MNIFADRPGIFEIEECFIKMYLNCFINIWYTSVLLLDSDFFKSPGRGNILGLPLTPAKARAYYF
jgi:hypothetical protein